ncbi:alkaline phosphatase PhoX [Pelagibius sp. 7325]|uniref:alkaline phosphatase PhoX n=1 Tax=Pelagibius sp. 7325 TaxID=3131994 RepID=UPI0030EDB8FD
MTDRVSEHGAESLDPNYQHDSQTINRRSMLKGAAAAVAGVSLQAAAFQAFLSKPAEARYKASSDYGPLEEVLDDNTGLPLLKLPKGFEYTTFSITGETMSDGSSVPPGHDGMACISERRGKITMVRNHELGGGTPFGPEGTPTFDATQRGGTTNLVFDTRRGELVEDWASLTGTIRNCAGGFNPLLTSWISCEETTNTGHGWLFNVPAHGTATAEPIRDAGRFSHEAVAVDPRTGVIYETEDSGICGFYRFTPKNPFNLEAGGKLEMARVKGSEASLSGAVNLNGGNAGRNNEAASYGLAAGEGIAIGQSFKIDWVEISEPEATGTSCVEQGILQGGCFFTRGEGAWYDDGKIFWTSTDGGEARQGQVWEFDIRSSKLTLIFESVDAFALNNPDNMTIAPSGAILLCEDGGGVTNSAGVFRGEQMVGLSLDGELFPFAENNIIIPAGQTLGGQTGDQRTREWCGATFSFDGDWLFANIQTPGITFAITGPWERGPLGNSNHSYNHHGMPFFAQADGPRGHRRNQGRSWA